MFFYTSIYGLLVRLNKQIPGIALSESPSSTVDMEITLGSMPSWFPPKELKRKVWYVRPEPEAGRDPRVVVWEVLGYDCYQVRYADGTQFLIDKPGSRIWATWPPETLTLEDTATYLLGPMMGFVLLLRGCTSLHASAIAVGDQAVALAGPAGSGKSTTAAAFASRGYGVMAEDVLSLLDLGDHFMVQPAYPCIRLWPSSVEALFGQTKLPKLTPTWDKCYLDLTQEQYVFRKEPLPLAVIYLLEPRSNSPTSPSIHEVPPNAALISLIANTYAGYLMDKAMRAREFDLLNRILKKIPVRKIVPHADPATIPKLCDAIIEDFNSLTSIKDTLETQEFPSHV